MKVKLKKGLLEKYGFSMDGGDFDETQYIAIDTITGKPIKYKDLSNHSNFMVSPFSVGDGEIEFLVVDHPKPISKEYYYRIKPIFEEVKDGKKSKKES